MKICHLIAKFHGLAGVRRGAARPLAGWPSCAGPWDSRRELDLGDDSIPRGGQQALSGPFDEPYPLQGLHVPMDVLVVARE